MSTEAKKIPPIPYPLSRRTRLTIMLSLIGAFCILAPIIVMYARGYTFDFPTHKIIHGGALSIETNPTNVNIFINDIQMKTSPPLRLSHILPGNYHIKIEGLEYFPWEKDISIVSNQTVYLHDIDLFKKDTPELVLSEEKKVNQIFPSRSTDFFIYSTHENDTFELSLYNAKTKKESFLTRVLSTTTPIIEWSDNGEALRIESIFNEGHTIMLMNPLNPTLIQTATTQTTVPVQWQGKNLVYQNGALLEQMNLDTRKTLFSLSTSTVTWFVDGNNTLWEYSNNTVRHLEDGRVVLTAPVSKPIVTFFDANEKRIIGSDGNTIVVYHFNNNGSVKEETLPVSHLTFFAKQNYWLSWEDGELWGISQDGTANLINRFSESIEDVIPLTDVGTLLIVTNTKLFTFHPVYYIPHELLQAENIERVSVEKKRREVYVLGTIAGSRRVWRLGY